ncbi:MAG: FlgB family protein [Rhodobacteraceae bacterium]|nr:FlgB family protein [Paracoccaceae bacterium]
MFDRLEIFQMAQAMAVHAAARQTAVAGNVANADTPGYRARDAAPFAQTYESMNTGAAAMRATRPGHVGAGQAGPAIGLRNVAGEAAPNGNSVSLEAEMVRATEVRGQHERALAIYRSGLHILRTTIGRG